MSESLRHDWKTDEIDQIYHLPFPELIYRSSTIHRNYHDPNSVQFCTLLSIKTGGCPEDCGYCPQSAHYNVPAVERSGLLEQETILAAAETAKGEATDCTIALSSLFPDNRNPKVTLAPAYERYT